jgi:hypothetical protein
LSLHLSSFSTFFRSSLPSSFHTSVYIIFQVSFDSNTWLFIFYFKRSARESSIEKLKLMILKSRENRYPARVWNMQCEHYIYERPWLATMLLSTILIVFRVTFCGKFSLAYHTVSIFLYVFSAHIFLLLLLLSSWMRKRSNFKLDNNK